MNSSNHAIVSFDVEPGGDHVSIRGERLPLDGLLDPRLKQADYVETLRRQFVAAQPFEHLVVEGLFHPRLLALAEQEFELFPPVSWRSLENKHESTMRSEPGSALGPASRIYFDLVNSAPFMSLLSRITAVDDLICDPYRYGGGLHESRAGGRFGIHLDFDCHVRTGLKNEMVLLTYLNRDWDSDWNGDLELWDSRQRARAASVRPDMGRSVLLRHGADSFHGHPRPLAAPPGRVRRSLANYYYSNPQAGELREKRRSSVFLFADRADRLHSFGKRWTPPALWDGLKRLARD